MGLHEREGHVALPHVPDTQHAILASSGHYMLLVRVSVHAMQGHSVPSAAETKQVINIHNQIQLTKATIITLEKSDAVVTFVWCADRLLAAYGLQLYAKVWAPLVKRQVRLIF